jgi:F1F0 ATPase subunit 2
MTWNEALMTGAGLGLAYFGGLWLTVRYLSRGRRGVLLAASRCLRLGLVGLTFYGLSRDGVGMVLSGLAGLWLARWCLIRQLSGGQHDVG